ncbi:type II 3-dehydroquinate dehydratase [Amphiplicatus metriothermophilus]|uniref:3-dehydroquinate dehydratase n=1 Tax=Amphiplicatus metriothermophilus TaxID=1519374 RepID=A0A239PWW5_9PROT|nr:type II 3-dehydroquinate dehydratase [Amphiplicatus metriothermophilus]MBB5519613.1 3-dehydroquinate dehydratase-2 [Amphiplicatus metriothermophilus]SNT74177.1 3-dehydroquinate dehydratase [Amphiplicatus metriothermophilus]
MTATVYILNGPNLNLLGTREPEIYGATTLAEIEAAAKDRAEKLNLAIEFRQTNHEGVLIDWTQESGAKAAGLILNPGAYTHTSIALHDALKALAIPKIELHLSNIHAREPFRRTSFASPAVDGILCGFGAMGYVLALDAMRRLIDKRA